MEKAALMQEVMLKFVDGMATGDIDALVNLFADNAEIEDPIGADVFGTGEVKGRATIDAFLRNGLAAAKPKPTLVGPVRTTFGNEAAIALEVEMEFQGNRIRNSLIDTFVFDDAGKILKMRSYWNMLNVTPL